MVFFKYTPGTIFRYLQLTIVVGLMLIFPSVVSAATYYVDGANLGGTCSNSANGTSLATAWCTVQKAASTAVAGDTVYIREHTYRETVNVVNSGNVSNPITFAAYANEDPIISGADSPSNWSSLGDESGLGAAFSDGFEANDDTFSGYALNVDSGNTIEAQNSVVNNGEYAFAATFGGTNRNARITETAVDTSGGADVYTRFFFRINSNYDLLTNDSAQLIFQSRSSGVLRSRVNLFQNASGQYYINATAFNPANESQVTLGSSTPGSIVPNTWYNIEIRYKGGDPTTGGAEAWLNGVSLGSIYTWPTSTTTIDRIEIGGNNGSSVPGAGSVLYIDDVIVSNAFNGGFDGGNSNQYRIPLSIRPLLVYENGEPLASSSRAALSAGRWHWDNVAEILYVQTTNGQNPSGVVDVAQRGNGFSLLNRSYVVFDGLTVELTNALASTLSNGQRFSGGAFSLASSSRITIRNANIRDNVGSGVALTGATNNTIATSTFTRNYRDFGGGIRLEAGSHDNLMAGNTITGIGLEGGNGINFCGDAGNCQGVGNDRNIIRDNSFYNLFDSCVYVAARSNYNILERNRCGKSIRWSPNGGISFGGGAGFHISRGSSYNIMRNNFFYDTETAGISIQSDELDGVETAVYGNEVYNNTVYNPGTSYGGNHGGISVVADAYGTIIRNNIVYQSNLVMGIRVTGAAAQSTNSDYNIYFSTRRNQTNTADVSDRVFHWGDSGDYYASISALRAVYPTQEANSLLVDPDITDAANGDFRLLLSSPAINAGMSVATVTDDFYRTSRPQGGVYDIGAHEYLSVAPDLTAPIITNRVATPSTTTALITWTTNEAADSLIEYGLTTSYGASTTLSAPLVTSHSRTISGLAPSTTYFFRVRARDAALNTASSTGSFTTSAAADLTAPIISSLVATPSTSTALITWNTNEAADSLIEYGLTTAYGATTSLSVGLVTSHSRTISGLATSTTYFFRVRSRDAALNSSTQTGSFTTTNTPDITSPIISSVVSSPATSSAVITWTTNEAADSFIDYGLSTSYGLTAALDSTLRTNHSRTLTGLSPNTLYYYRIRSRDGSLNSSTVTGSFTTSAAADLTAPIISSVVATPSTSTATITWNTNEAADSFIDYGLSTSYGLTAALDTTLRTSHSRTLISLTASTTYFFRVRSRDGSLNSSTQTGFFTTADVVVGTSTPTTPPVVTPPRRGGGGGGGGGSRTTKATTTSPTGFYLPPPTATTTLPQMLVTISALISKPLPTSVSDLTQVVNYLKAVLIKLIQARSIPVTQPITPTTPTTPTITTSVATLTFPRDLTVGSTGEDVRRLQQWLNQNGYLIARDGPGSPGNETTYYGPSTAFAVGRLQVTYGIKPYDGTFNAVTREIWEKNR